MSLPQPQRPPRAPRDRRRSRLRLDLAQLPRASRPRPRQNAWPSVSGTPSSSARRAFVRSDASILPKIASNRVCSAADGVVKRRACCQLSRASRSSSAFDSASAALRPAAWRAATRCLRDQRARSFASGSVWIVGDELLEMPIKPPEQVRGLMRPGRAPDRQLAQRAEKTIAIFRHPSEVPRSGAADKVLAPPRRSRRSSNSRRPGQSVPVRTRACRTTNPCTIVRPTATTRTASTARTRPTARDAAPGFGSQGRIDAGGGCVVVGQFRFRDRRHRDHRWRRIAQPAAASPRTGLEQPVSAEGRVSAQGPAPAGREERSVPSLKRRFGNRHGHRLGGGSDWDIRTSKTVRADQGSEQAHPFAAEALGST